jgi:hypothetical protein
MADYGGLAFKMPDIAGTYQGKNLIICADAACVWIDLELFGARDDTGRGRVAKPGWDIMAVNKIVEVLPATVEHCYSNQARVITAAIAARRDEYKREFTFEPKTHSCNPGAQYHWPWAGYGTSGLGACFVGLALGYEKIVLCGMPLEDGPHNGEPHWRSTTFASSEACGRKNDDRDVHWIRAIENGFGGKVRSMSGRTRTWLGDPMPWK